MTIYSIAQKFSSDTKLVTIFESLNFSSVNITGVHIFHFIKWQFFVQPKITILLTITELSWAMPKPRLREYCKRLSLLSLKNFCRFLSSGFSYHVLLNQGPAKFQSGMTNPSSNLASSRFGEISRYPVCPLQCTEIQGSFPGFVGEYHKRDIHLLCIVAKIWVGICCAVFRHWCPCPLTHLRRD